MRNFIRIGGLGLIAALFGCNPNVACHSQVTAVHEPDGGRFVCAVSEDCPRLDNVIVCVNDGTPQRECVRCVASQCESVAPAGC